MSTIFTNDFLLQTEAARRLYHEYSKNQPIIDYHSHLDPKLLALDQKFDNLTQLWLTEDHYKWRAMRANGIEEKYITGNTTDKEKFLAWAKTVPNTLKNPLFHWTHLELKAYFGIEEYLSPKTADNIYEQVQDQLKDQRYTAKGFPRMMNVETIGTTDDPIDDLQYHKQLRDDGYEVKVLPTFRPDNALKIEDTVFFQTYLNKLGAAANIEISSLDKLIEALESRVEYFDSIGCKLSDHGLPYLHSVEFDLSKVTSGFTTALNGNKISPETAEQYKSYLLFQLGKMYHKKGWVQQFHLGPLRNNNSRFLKTIGADSGVDSIGDQNQAIPMSKFFDRLDRSNQLAKTIVYNLNPADNEIFATMIGNFQDGQTAGKMQFGSGWWFSDQKDGMEKQINTLSNQGLISQFVGMLTDSRSLLSFPRHEYFRRTLCNIFGNDIESGEIPNDIAWIGEIISNISYGNAKRYFNF